MALSLITSNNSQITYVFNAIQEMTAQLRDWLPIFISILVVIIGVFLTYDRNIAIEEKKRQYELKKQTYIELLDILIEFQKLWDEIRELNTLKNGNSVEQSEGVNAAFRRFNKTQLYRLKLIEYKFRLCGGSEEINKIISDNVGAPENYINPEKADYIFMNELIPAMEKDLIKNELSWWQFWRR